MVHPAQKITFAEMREMGVRGLLVYCADYRCSHSIAISGDQWPDDLRLSDIEHRLVCEVCGKRASRGGPVAKAETVKSKLAAQIRTQGFACDKPLEATRDAKLSKPNYAVWVLKCDNATYRIGRYTHL